MKNTSYVILSRKIKKEKTLYFIPCSLSLHRLKGPDGGIGRRAGLKHQWGNPCRFDPGSGYRVKTLTVIFRLLAFFLCGMLLG